MASTASRKGAAADTPADTPETEEVTGEPTVVYLGNRNAVERPEDPDDVEAAAAEGRSVRRLEIPAPGKRATKVVIPAEVPMMQAAYEITHPTRGVWAAHSTGAAPAWVASTNPALAGLLAAHWHTELREVDENHVASGGVVDEPMGG